LQGLNGFGGASGMNQLSGNSGAGQLGSAGFDLLGLQQMHMGSLSSNYPLSMMQMPFIPPLYQQQSNNSLGGGQMGGNSGGGGHGSAASFHQPTEKN